MTRDRLSLAARILANSLRLYFRSWQGKRKSLGLTLLIQAVLIGFLHLQVPVLFRQISTLGSSPGGAGLACTFVLLFILMAGFQRSLEVLYNRGDLPYLLSSPVPSRIVVVTRLADVLATTLLTTLFVVMPMLNGAVYLFGKHWLWGWLAWLLGATSVATFALLTTLWAVKVIGARGARTLLQLLGVIVGTCAILAMQAPNWLRQLPGHPERAELLRHYLDAFATPPLTQLVAAAAGDIRWLVALAVLAGVATGMGIRALEREFVAGAQSAAADTVAESALPERERKIRLARAWQQAFRSGRWRNLVSKELRTLRRDPLLIARASSQLISFLPAVVGLFFLPRLTALAVFVVMVSSMTAMTTAALMSAGDESLDLLGSSPTSRGAALWARTLAAMIPSLWIAWGTAAALIISGTPALGLSAGLLSTYLALAHAWLGGCTTRRHTAEERAANRPLRMTWQVLASMAVTGLGIAAVATLGMGAPLALPILFAALTLVFGGMMFLASPRPVWDA